MASRRTSAEVQAREFARLRIAKANEARREREKLIEDVVTEFELHRIPRDEAADAIVREELNMAAALGKLLDLNEPVKHVREILGLSDDVEYNRLRKLLPEKKSAGSRSAGQDGRSAATTNEVTTAAP